VGVAGQAFRSGAWSPSVAAVKRHPELDPLRHEELDPPFGIDVPAPGGGPPRTRLEGPSAPASPTTPSRADRRCAPWRRACAWMMLRL